MTAFTIERFGRFAGSAGLLGVLLLIGVVLVPDSFFWTAVLAAALVGSAVATAVLMRSRANPTLAQVVATAKAEYRARPSRVGPSSEAGLRARGE